MIEKKPITKKAMKKIKGGTPGPFDYFVGGPYAAKDVLDAIKNYFN